MFVFLLLAILFPLQIFAGIGDTDNRYYVTDEMWAQEPYKKFVLLKTYVYEKLYTVDENNNEKEEHKLLWGIGNCSAQFISPNLILSAGHCVKGGDQDLVRYRAINYKGERFPLRLVYTPWIPDTEEVGIPNDFAVWLVTEPQYHSESYFDVKVPTKKTNVINAGWGWARVIPDSELKTIRDIFDIIAEGNKNTTVETMEEKLIELLPKFDIKPIREEGDKLKASECTIIFNDCAQRYREDENNLRKTITNKSLDMDTRLQSFDELKALQAKIDKKCDRGALEKSKYFPEILATTCDTWGGNSGGGYISGDGKNVFGIVHAGASTVYDSTDSNYMTSSKQFKEKLSELITMYDSKNSYIDNINKIPKNVLPEVAKSSKTQEKESELSQQMNVQIVGLQSDVQKLKNHLETKMFDVKNMTNEELLAYLNKLVEHDVKKERLEELQKAYEEAKANEQSLANRTLTALTVAATGLGGMELAMGLAEQKADKEADMDMTAYIETMRCTYGDGKQVKAGPEEIELPGGNNAELMKLRSEYFALANDLKERKEALGMKPDIESEVVMDKSQMGLYDDENIGITDGVYASLYRAKALNSETDQAKINEDKEASKNRVIAGSVLAGVGVVGSVVGNSLINGKLGVKNSKNNKNDSDIKEKMNELCSMGACKSETIKNMNDAQIKQVINKIAQMKQLKQQGNADEPELDLGNIGEVLKNNKLIN